MLGMFATLLLLQGRQYQRNELIVLKSVRTPSLLLSALTASLPHLKGSSSGRRV